MSQSQGSQDTASCSTSEEPGSCLPQRKRLRGLAEAGVRAPEGGFGHLRGSCVPPGLAAGGVQVQSFGIRCDSRLRSRQLLLPPAETRAVFQTSTALSQGMHLLSKLS